MILRLTRFWTLIWIKRFPRAWFFQAAAELGLPGVVSKRGRVAVAPYGSLRAVRRPTTCTGPGLDCSPLLERLKVR